MPRSNRTLVNVSLVSALVLSLATAGCDQPMSEVNTAVDLHDGPSLLVGEFVTEYGVHHLSMQVNGIDGDVTLWEENGTLLLSQQVAGDYLLMEISEAGMVVERSNGENLRRTIAQRSNDRGELSPLTDRIDVQDLPNRALGYPFAEDDLQRVALIALQQATDTHTNFQGYLDDAVSLTLQLEKTDLETIHVGGMVGLNNDEGPAPRDPTLNPVEQEPQDVECGELMTKRWSSSAANGGLNAGPVTVEVQAPNVKGSSRCDLAHSVNTSSSNSYTANYDPAGGSGGGCAWGYEALYTIGGTMVADASHGDCCFADGASDTASAGSLSVTAFGTSFGLSGALNNQSNDMSSAAQGKITGSATLCLDFDFFNEVMLLSDTVTTNAFIN